MSKMENTFLWTKASDGGAAVWGEITGDINNQIDLKNSINNLQTNILVTDSKTNQNSIDIQKNKMDIANNLANINDIQNVVIPDIVSQIDSLNPLKTFIISGWNLNMVLVKSPAPFLTVPKTDFVSKVMVVPVSGYGFDNSSSLIKIELAIDSSGDNYQFRANGPFGFGNGGYFIAIVYTKQEQE